MSENITPTPMNDAAIMALASHAVKHQPPGGENKHEEEPLFLASPNP
jgi:hypothetical protein